jgi:hypothetical protein
MARARFNSGGFVSQSNQFAASILPLRVPAVAGADPLRERSNPCKT